jgi:hypothetical protein
MGFIKENTGLSIGIVIVLVGAFLSGFGYVAEVKSQTNANSTAIEAHVTSSAESLQDIKMDIREIRDGINDIKKELISGS